MFGEAESSVHLWLLIEYSLVKWEGFGWCKVKTTRRVA